MDLNLKGKVAIVTGGGSGLGASISEALSMEGCSVVVNYIVDEANTFRFVDYLNEKYDTNAIPLYGDITKAADIDNVIARASTYTERWISWSTMPASGLRPGWRA